MAAKAPKFIDYPSVRWNVTWCKLCAICVEACSQQALQITPDGLSEIDGRCIRCGLCERQCPDLAIEVIALPTPEDNK